MTKKHLSGQLSILYKSFSTCMLEKFSYVGIFKVQKSIILRFVLPFHFQMSSVYSACQFKMSSNMWTKAQQFSNFQKNLNFFKEKTRNELTFNNLEKKAYPRFNHKHHTINRAYPTISKYISDSCVLIFFPI